MSTIDYRHSNLTPTLSWWSFVDKYGRAYPHCVYVPEGTVGLKPGLSCATWPMDVNWWAGTEWSQLEDGNYVSQS